MNACASPQPPGGIPREGASDGPPLPGRDETASAEESGPTAAPQADGRRERSTKACVDWEEYEPL